MKLRLPPPDHALHPQEFLKRKLAPAAASVRFITVPQVVMLLVPALMVFLVKGGADQFLFAAAFAVMAVEILAALIVEAILGRAVEATGIPSSGIFAVLPAARSVLPRLTACTRIRASTS